MQEWVDKILYGTIAASLASLSRVLLVRGMEPFHQKFIAYFGGLTFGLSVNLYVCETELHTQTKLGFVLISAFFAKELVEVSIVKIPLLWSAMLDVLKTKK